MLFKNLKNVGWAQALRSQRRNIHNRFLRQQEVGDAPLFSIMPLEDRIVLDGGLVGEALQVVADAAPATTVVPINNVALIASDAPDVQGIKDAFVGTNTQVIVIDANATQADILTALANASDNGRAPITSLSLFSHGRNGAFQFGETTVSENNVQQFSSLWQGIDANLVDGGQFLVYGCNLASSANGQGFIDALANMVNADVYASNDTTGQGGDWVLEVSSQGAQTFSDAMTPVVDALLASVQGQLGIVAIDAIGSTNLNQPFITGTGVAGDSVQLIGTGPTAFTGSSFVDAQGVWTFNTANQVGVLADGNYSLTATTATNNAQITFTVDTVAPAVTDATPASATVSLPSISGTAEAGASIAVIITGNGTTQTMNVTTAVSGVWSGVPTTPLSTGTYTLNVSATDAAGNIATLLQRNLIINVPINPPTITATTPTNTPAASGTGIAGRTIIVDVLNNGGTIVKTQTVTVGAAGDWTTSFIGLTDAAYTVNATQSDGVNTSVAATATMVIDTTALAPIVNTLGLQVTNAGNTLYIANTATPTITGTGEAGATVTLSDSAGLIANTTAVVDALGNWTATLPNAADGRYTLLLTQVDALGNSSAATPSVISMQIDTAVTGLAITSLPQSNLNFPTIIGSGESAIGTGNINTVSVIITDQANAANTQTITSNVINGLWTAKPVTGLVAGTYTVSVTETDEVGNTATITQVLAVTPVIAPPTIALSRTVATNPSTLAVALISGTGLANAGSTVTVTLQDTITANRLPVSLAAVAVDINGNWSLANTALAALIDSTYSITATQTTTTGDVIGTSVAATAVTAIFDTATITPVINTVDTVPVVGGSLITSNPLPVIAATAEAGATVAIALDAVTIGNVTTDALTGAFTYTPTALADGAHIITFTATDNAGNVSAVNTLNITVDTTAIAPIVDTIGTVFAAVHYTNATPTISGTGEAGATVSISGLQTLNNVQLPLTTVVDQLGVWTVPVPAVTPLIAGVQTIAVTQTDAAGNVSPPALAQSFVVDDVVKPLSITSAATQAVSFPIISGAGETARANGVGAVANSVTVTIADAVGTVATLTANVTNSVWSVTPATALVDGIYTVTVTQTDELGNTGTATQSMTVGVTIVPPVINTPATASNPALALTPLISGTGLDVVANGTVIVVTATDNIGGITTLGSPATLTMTGTAWSLANSDAVLNALADGIYTISVTQQTTAGQTIGTSLAATATLLLDTVANAPVVNTVDAVAWNALTPLTISNTQPAIAITVEPNASVAVIIDGNTLAPVIITADGAGLATFTPQTALTGPTPPATSVVHNFTFSQTDAAGNSSIATTISMSIDNLSLPPTINPIGTLVGATQVVGANPTFAGTGEVGAIVTITGVTDALGAAIPLTAVVDALGAWTATLPVGTILSDAVYNISLTQTDTVGNVSASTPAKFTVDTMVIPLTIDSAANQSNNIFALSGTAELARGAVANVISLTITDNAALPGALPIIQQNLTITPSLVGGINGVWNVPQVTLGNGAYTVTINQTDETGNNLLVTQALTVLAVVQPPAVAIGSGGQANPALALSPIITGTAMNGALVNVTITPQLGAPVALTQVTASVIDGTWVIANTDVALAALLDGIYTVTATQTMNTGALQGTSVASAAQNLTIDKTALAPTASISNALANPAAIVTDAAFVAHTIVNTNTPLLSGTAEPGAFITISDPAAAIPPAVTPASDIRLNGRTLTTFADAAGAWSVNIQALGADGLVNLNVIQQDVANNTSVAQVVSFEIDTTVNNLAINNANSSTISFPVFTGTAEIALSAAVANTVSIDILLGDGFGNPLLDPLTSLPTLVETIAATVTAAGTWVATPLAPLPVGELIINLNQTDEAGNTLVSTQVFQSNPTVPPPVFTNLATQSVINPVTIAAAPAITGTALTGAGATVNVTLTQVQAVGAIALPNIINAVATVDALGVWQITGTQLLGQIDGTYAVTATQTTAAGQVIGTSLAAAAGADIILDTTVIAPSIQTVDGTLVAAAGTHNTANTLPVIALQAEPNATLNITLDGVLQVPLTPYTADAQGLFTFTPPVALAGSAAGTAHTLSITQTDLAGNVSVASTLTINVDNLALAPTVNAVGTLFGATQVSFIAAPAITGTAEIGASVSVSGLGVTVLPAIVDAVGGWSLSSPALLDGTHTITVTQTDAQGNVSAATNSSFVIDTTNNITVPIIQTVNAGSMPTISGTGEIARGAIANTVTVTVRDNAAAIGAPAIATVANVVIDAAGIWTTTLVNPLPNGAYTVTVTGTDEVGNAKTVTQSLTMGAIIPAPTVTFTSPANPNVGGTAATILSGTNELGAVINVSITDPANPIAAAKILAATVVGTTWTITNAQIAALALVDGRYTVAITQDRIVNTVNIGTSPAATGSFILDTVALAPVVNPVGNNLGGTQVSNATPIIRGKAEVGSTITVNNAAWATALTTTADGVGNWTITVPVANSLVNGGQTINVTQTDAVGNMSPVTPVVFTVDTQYTPLTFTSAITETATSLPTITGTGELALGINANTVTISISDNAAPIGTLPVQQLTNIAVNPDPLVATNGIWTITLPKALANAAYTVTVTGTDEVGNTATMTQQLTVNVPIPTPGLTTPATAVNPSLLPTSAITGTNIAGATVNVTLTDPANIAFVPVTLTPVVTGTIWTVSNQQLQLLADGAYQVSVTQTLTNPPLGVGLGTSAALVGGITLDRVANSPIITPFGNPITTNAGISYLINNPTPTISGTAEAGAKVTLNSPRFAAPVIVTADATGAWTTLLPNLGADGVITMTGQQTDVAGNTAASPAIFTFTLDTAISNLTITSAATTTLSLPDIIGTGESAIGQAPAVNNATVTITDQLSGVVHEVLTVAIINGSWTATPQIPLLAATYDISVTQTDEAGNISPAITQVLKATPTVAPPTIALHPSANTLNPATPPATAVIAGKGITGGSIIVTLTNTGNGLVTNTFAAVSVDATSNWTIPNAQLVGIADGSYVASATQTMTTGATLGTSQAVNSVQNLTIDSIAPAAPTIALSSTQVPKGTTTATATFTGEVDATIAISIDGVLTGQKSVLVADPLNPAVGVLTISLPTALTIGAHSISGTQTDVAGNVSVAGNTPYTITPAATNIISASNPAVANPAVTNIDPMIGALAGAPVTIVADPRVSGVSPTVVNLHPATNAQGAIIIDPFNDIVRVGPANLQSVVVKTDPLTGINPVTGGTLDAVISNNLTPVIAGQLQDTAGNPVTLAQLGVTNPNILVAFTDAAGNVQSSTTTMLANGSWSLDLAALPAAGANAVNLTEGNYKVSAQPIAGAGVFSFDLVVDTIKPIVPSIIQFTEINGVVSVSGTAEPGSRVVVQINPTAVVTADALGQWAITGLQLTAGQTYTLFLFSMDLATNTSTVTPFSFTIAKVGGGIQINQPSPVSVATGIPIMAGNVLIDTGVLQGITGEVVKGILDRIVGDVLQQGGTARHVIFGPDGLRVIPDTGLLAQIVLRTINGFPLTSHPGSSYDTGAPLGEPYRLQPIDTHRLGNDVADKGGFVGQLAIRGDKDGLLGDDANASIEASKHANLRDALNSLHFATTSLGNNGRIYPGRLAMFAPERQGGDAIRMDAALNSLDDVAKLRLEGGFPVGEAQLGLVLFDFDRYNIKTAFAPMVRMIPRIWDKSTPIRIIGHTDYIGTDEYNKKLGMQRALAVKNTLVRLGISPKVIMVESMGETQPIADNKTDTGRAQNRRAEVHVSGAKLVI